VAEQYEVKVTVGDAIVEVRGAQQGVVAIVEALSKILAGAPRTAGAEAGGEGPPAGGRPSRGSARRCKDVLRAEGALHAEGGDRGRGVLPSRASPRGHALWSHWATNHPPVWRPVGVVPIIETDRRVSQEADDLTLIDTPKQDGPQARRLGARDLSGCEGDRHAIR